MRLIITRRSSSLYSKGLIAIGEQDQDTGALVHSKQPWRRSCSKTTSISRENQELNKTQILRRGTAANYRAPDVNPLVTPPNGPKYDTRSNGPKDGVATP